MSQYVGRPNPIVPNKIWQALGAFDPEKERRIRLLASVPCAGIKICDYHKAPAAAEKQPEIARGSIPVTYRDIVQRMTNRQRKAWIKAGRPKGIKACEEICDA